MKERTMLQSWLIYTQENKKIFITSTAKDAKTTEHFCDMKPSTLYLFST